MADRLKGSGLRRAASKSSSVAIAARKLQQRKQRALEGRCLADGPQSVEYGLRAELVERIFVSIEGQHRHDGLVAQAVTRGIEVIDVDEQTLAGISDTRTPQGIVGVARIPTWSQEPWTRTPRLVVALEQAQDPGNVGVIVRTADAAGADFVILGPGSADAFGPKAIRSSAGSVFRVPTYRVESVPEALERARRAGLRSRGTAGDGPCELFNDDALALGVPTLWVFGNEAHGLSAKVRDRCDDVVRIPIFGECESLNVATAAAVCLYASASVLAAGALAGS